MRRGKLAVLGLLLAGGLAAAVGATQDPVYTIPQVLAGLSRDPAAWSGRTALVQGAALELVPGCPRGQWCPTGLYNPGTPRPGPILLLEPAPPSLLVQQLRALPLVQAVVPAPQRLRWRTPATYRLLFHVVPHTSCDAKPCINALLVDSAV